MDSSGDNFKHVIPKVILPEISEISVTITSTSGEKITISEEEWRLAQMDWVRSHIKRNGNTPGVVWRYHRQGFKACCCQACRDERAEAKQKKHEKRLAEIADRQIEARRKRAEANQHKMTKEEIIAKREEILKMMGRT